MIRRATPQDTDRIIQIWLSASRLAHDFIPLTFWEARVDDMRNTYLPASETYVIEQRGEVVAFLSLVNDYLAALFVDEAEQRRGHGKALVEFAKSNRNSLSLCVYSQNARAVQFYKHGGFQITEERVEPTTGEHEKVMVWKEKA